jgi:N6-adenosine-specific RNA methylase IME4
MGNYRVILADPAWQYGWAHGNGAAEHHYPTMPTPDICALPVADLAAPDSLLFLWATWPLLPDALQVMAAWGWAYKTLGFIWIKRNPSNIGLFMGTGQYTRANSEPCLLGVRGEAHRLRVDAGVFSIIEAEEVIEAPRRAHSRKPDEQYTRIDRLVGDVPRVELFARYRQPGWAAWGHGVTGALPLAGFAEGGAA